MAAQPYTIRPLDTLKECQACVALQRETWGAEFSDCVPPSILQVCQRVGGVAAGAFDDEGALVGFVFGISGVEKGRLVHWSDMVAVRRPLWNQGLGRTLKLYQRGVLLERGIETIYWTYDPLVARNAHFNFNKLGIRASEYVADMYGGDTSSDLHRGLGTDRFIVDWEIGTDRVAKIIAGERPVHSEVVRRAPIVNTAAGESGAPQPGELQAVEGEAVRVEIPAEIQQEKKLGKNRGHEWRQCTRAAFTHYMDRGYEVSGFFRDEAGRCFYGLTRV